MAGSAVGGMRPEIEYDRAQRVCPKGTPESP